MMAASRNDSCPNKPVPNQTKYYQILVLVLRLLLPCCTVITVLSVSVRVCVCQPLRSCTLYIFYIEIRFSLFSGFLFDLYYTYLTSRPGLTVVSSSCPRDGQLVYSRALTTVFNNLTQCQKFEHNPALDFIMHPSASGCYVRI
jgi:hypothetical protein